MLLSRATIVVVVVGCLCLFIFSPYLTLIPLAILLLVGLMRLIFSEPTIVLGAVLAIMPVHYLAAELARLYGIQYVTVASAAIDIIFLLTIVGLWGRNHFRPTSADWFLLALACLGAVRLAFGGTFLDFKGDFMWLLAYAAGRVTILTPTQERAWATRAVWIAALVAVVGMIEVFFLGPEPRTLLFTTVTDEDSLGPSNFAGGFSGLREASTMPGPLEFAALCMVCLLIWWIYSRRPIPGVMILAGLILSVTRSAWLGTAVAFSFLAIRLGRKQTLAVFAVVAVTVLLLAPLTGLGRDYFRAAFVEINEDTSAEGHKQTIQAGLIHLLEHPLGSGIGSVGPYAIRKNANALLFESTYLQYAGEFGLPGLLCFLGFLGCSLRLCWAARSPAGNAATGILIGIMIMMVVLLMHGDFHLSCWLWFPVGLAIGQVHPGIERSPQPAAAAIDSPLAHQYFPIAGD